MYFLNVVYTWADDNNKSDRSYKSENKICE